MSEMETTPQNELLIGDAVVLQSKEAQGDEARSVLHCDSKRYFAVPIMSGGDSDSEEIEISELRRRIWKNQMLLRKLEERITSNEFVYADYSSIGAEQADRESVQCSNPFQCSLQKQPRTSNRKTLQRAEDGVLRCMLKLMRDCDARGFVYGILPKTGPPITGSSDSMRAWWKDVVVFERNAPLAAVIPDVVLPVVEQTLVSYLRKLEDMNNNTIGSILSALIQHCEPPQRSFPFDQETVPPWWPTGKEIWWDLQGKPQAELGPPPYRKPHDLRKGWKLSLLAAVIKHMIPRFDHMRNLVWQSKRLQHKMSTKDVDTWSRVLNQEEALVEHTKKSLVIAPLDDGCSTGSTSGGADFVGDDTTDTRKTRQRLENSRGNSSGNEICWEGDLMHDVDLDMNSVDELMRLYQQESSSADFSASF